jgi:hypothetical protein
MYPVELPKHIGGEVQWTLRVPLIVDVVTEFFDAFGNLKSTRRFMSASAYFDLGRPPVPCILRDPRECYPMKV